MADDLQNIIQTIQGMATNAAQPEAREPGPGEVGPSSEVKPEKSQLVTLKMTEEEVGDWFARIELAIERRKKREEQWDLLLDEYLPVVTKSGAAETVKVPRHFRDVHSKIGSLFYRYPDLTFTPKDLSPAQNTMNNPITMTTPGQHQAPPSQMEDLN